MEILFEKIYELLYPSYMLAAFLASTGFIRFVKRVKPKRKRLAKLVNFFAKNKPTSVLAVSSITGIIFYILFSQASGYDYDYVVKLFTSYLFTVTFYDVVIKQFKIFWKNEEIKPADNSPVITDNSGPVA